jgi:hypothetical protein
MAASPVPLYRWTISDRGGRFKGEVTEWLSVSRIIAGRFHRVIIPMERIKHFVRKMSEYPVEYTHAVL